MQLWISLLISPLFFFAFSTIWEFAFFVVGWLIAVVLLWFDQTIAYHYYAEPEKPVQLITRSPLFLVVYIPMTLFVITSSGSSLGMGIVLGIGAILCTELWWWRQHIEILNGRFYAHAAKPLTLNEFTWLTRFLAVFLAIMTLFIYL